MGREEQSSAAAGAALRLASGRLTIDLAALAANYRTLTKLSAPAETAAVVKADAYGIGIERAVPVLWDAGCRRFFVALPEEGIAVRKSAPEAEIFVLGGFFSAEAAADYARARLIPVLNSETDIAMWEAHGWDDGEAPRPCAIHIDTGMNRLGLSVERARLFAEDNALTGAITPILVMSHLVSADEPSSPMSQRQLERFQQVCTSFPGVQASLANSAGIFRGHNFVFDVVRPGIALYGGAAVAGVENPMLPVVTAEARILQIRQVRTGETVGYGGAARLERNSVVAIAGAGYADGYPRSTSGAGVPLRRAETAGAAGFLHGHAVPVLGRVSMDMTAFDITALGLDAVGVGDFIELFGPNMPVDAVAKAAGTIAYELLTQLSRRFHRTYLGE